MRLRPIVFALLAALLVHCATLEKLPSSTCGNGVVDANEDCDSFPGDQCGTPESGPAQCRLLCNRSVRVKDETGKETDKALVCPAGWGCSTEGFCRQPTGELELEESRERVSVGVTTMLVGDFDGDRRKDIFGTSALGTTQGKGRIHYFGDRGALAETVALPAVVASPFVRDFDGDKRDDLAFGYGFRVLGSVTAGFAVVLGQADRALVPKLFPSFTREHFDGTVLPLEGATPPGVPPLIAIGKAQERATGATVDIVLSVDLDLEGRTGFRKDLPADARGIAGSPVVASIFGRDTTSTCGEVIVPINTPAGPRVQVYSPCTRSPVNAVVWARARTPAEVLLPNGETSIRGVHATDADGNGTTDIFVAGGSGTIYLALSDGMTLEPARPLDDRKIAPLRLKAALTELPLASGDINGDGVMDYMLPGGVQLSVRESVRDGGAGNGGGDPEGGVSAEGGTDPVAGYYAVKSPSKRWTVGLVADVNRDGVLDAIGASRSEPDVDVLAGIAGPGLVLPSFTVTTNGTVQQLLAIDLDLDTTRDLVIVESRVASDESDVTIAYGRALAMPPEPGRKVGRATGVRQLFPQRGNSLAIATSTPAASPSAIANFSLAVLFASGERLPLAPLLLDESASHPQRAKIPASGERDWLARVVAAGVIEKRGRVDLVCLAEGRIRSGFADGSGADRPASAFGIWSAAGTGGASFEGPRERVVLEEIEQAVRSAPVDFSLILQARTVDLDGDGIAEVVALTPGPTGTVIRTFNVAGEVGKVLGPLPQRSLRPSSRIEVLDADGDGRVDLVALLADPAGTLGVNIFYGDGVGGFQVPGIVVPLPASSTPQDASALGFAMFTSGAGGADDAGGAADVKHEMAIVTPKRLLRASFGKERGDISVKDETPRLPGGLAGATDVAAGDFDGDGVEDLAIADSGAIRIVRQRPRLQ